jgi:hypothetical protein
MRAPLERRRSRKRSAKTVRAAVQKVGKFASAGAGVIASRHAGQGERLRETVMSRELIAVGVLLIAMPGEILAQGKGIRLWNLTTATISGFQLSPAGKNAWGPNQTLNDRDKEVDHDERLRLTGVEPGRYDAKVSYSDSRQCFVRDIDIRAEAVFSIADKDLRDCNK